jgi:hypothetical protein
MVFVSNNTTRIWMQQRHFHVYVVNQPYCFYSVVKQPKNWNSFCNIHYAVECRAFFMLFWKPKESGLLGLCIMVMVCTQMSNYFAACQAPSKRMHMSRAKCDQPRTCWSAPMRARPAMCVAFDGMHASPWSQVHVHGWTEDDIVTKHSDSHSVTLSTNSR